MSKNYNTTLGLPYSRIQNINIDYGTERISVTFRRGEAVVVGGSVRKLEGETQYHSFCIDLTPESLSQAHPLRDYNTGEPTGQQTTVGQAILCLMAVLRAKEIELDNAV